MPHSYRTEPGRCAGPCEGEVRIPNARGRPRAQRSLRRWRDERRATDRRIGGAVVGARARARRAAPARAPARLRLARGRPVRPLALPAAAAGHRVAARARCARAPATPGTTSTDEPQRRARAGADAAARGILHWLDGSRCRPSVGLLGFSQGGAIAAAAAAPRARALRLRRQPRRLRRRRATPRRMPGSPTGRPPVFWGRGTLDEVIPPPSSSDTHDWLPHHATVDRAHLRGARPQPSARPSSATSSASCGRSTPRPPTRPRAESRSGMPSTTRAETDDLPRHRRCWPVQPRDAGVVRRRVPRRDARAARGVGGDLDRRARARRRAHRLGQDARGVPLVDRPARRRADGGRQAVDAEHAHARALHLARSRRSASTSSATCARRSSASTQTAARLGPTRLPTITVGRALGRHARAGPAAAAADAPRHPHHDPRVAVPHAHVERARDARRRRDGHRRRDARGRRHQARRAPRGDRSSGSTRCSRSPRSASGSRRRCARSRRSRGSSAGRRP